MSMSVQPHTRRLWRPRLGSLCLTGAAAASLPSPPLAVYLSSPDGTALVRELSFEVPVGRRCAVMGAAGCSAPAER